MFTKKETISSRCNFLIGFNNLLLVFFLSKKIKKIEDRSPNTIQYSPILKSYKYMPTKDLVKITKDNKKIERMVLAALLSIIKSTFSKKFKFIDY